ncbi:MAG: competence/damage-inducible protein A [Verrucomicrobia bacterium]|nr:competence/damage-inducible protein A [Verrucomicrobiota bacterium]MDA1065861.1 competence/damage-inducible protein A [Verrucomicrobiota bacterium]
MNTSPIIDLITIGDELLLGLTRNGHLTYLGEQLAFRGAPPNRNIVCRDEAGEIRRNFELCWKESNIVITTGGLGPTSDDRTRDIIAEVLGLELLYSEEVEEAIRERFKSFKGVMGVNNKKQAYYPAGADIIMNAQGTAPGLWLEKDGKLLIMLPGPPRELNPMFENQVLPRLGKEGRLADAARIISFQTSGIGESSLELELDPILNQHSDINVAFCAHYGTVDVRLSSISGGTSLDLVQGLAGVCIEKLGSHFLTHGIRGITPVILDLLRERNETLAVAESCTGGLLGAAITAVPGSSDVFQGGSITYTNLAKHEMLGVSQNDLDEFGAVSEQVACAMAEGARQKFHSTWALSTTGIAGPGGGTPEKPVGMVFVGLAGPDGSIARQLDLRGNRNIVRERTVGVAQDFLRRQLLKKAIK